MVQVSKSIVEREKYVALLIDEIYIDKALTFKANNLVGMAANEALETASTVMAFMIKSTYGNFKEIVRLIPMKSPTGKELRIITDEVIHFVQSLKFKVIVIITDNNRVNQNLFKLFSERSIK